jgi:MFS family permease
LVGHRHALRDPRFFRFWVGETVSLVGSQITELALPLTAILVLQAGPAEMGILSAAAFLPFILFTLLAGVWIDRLPRRPLLAAANLGRALLIAFVPLAASLGLLRFELLLAVVFLVGILRVVFEVGYLAFVPSIVSRDQLTSANSALVGSASASEIGGPGLAGLLVAAAGAPFALLIDAASYVFSGSVIISIRGGEASRRHDQQNVGADQPAKRQVGRDFVGEIGEGLRQTFGNPYLRAFAAEAATYNGLYHAMAVLFLLYATRELGFGPAVIGLLFAIGSVGSLAGSVGAGRLADRFGLGPTIVGSMVIACSLPIAIPLAEGPRTVVFVLIATSLAVAGFGVAISNVHVVSLRQAVTPEAMLGRMNASYRTFVYGAIPIGSLVGGFLGEAIGLRPTLLIAALGLVLTPLWVLRSPVPRLRGLPTPDRIPDVTRRPGFRRGDP